MSSPKQEFENPIFSVIINCFNSEKFIDQTIRSVLAQTFKNFELVIVDNKSQDRTKDIIDSFTDSRIKYFKISKHVTLGEARNFGLKRTKGQFIGFLDSDDYWHIKKLELSLGLFDDSHGIVYSNVLYFSNKSRFDLYNKRTPHRGNCFEQLILDYSLCISSVLFRKSIISKNEIFFDNKLLVCEDFDFFVNLSKYTKLVYLPRTLSYYRIHENNLTVKKRLLFFDEIEYVIKKQNDLSFQFMRNCLDINKLNKSIFFWKSKKTVQAFEILNSVHSFKMKKHILKFVFLIPYSFLKKILLHKSIFD